MTIFNESLLEFQKRFEHLQRYSIKVQDFDIMNSSIVHLPRPRDLSCLHSLYCHLLLLHCSLLCLLYYSQQAPFKMIFDRRVDTLTMKVKKEDVDGTGLLAHMALVLYVCVAYIWREPPRKWKAGRLCWHGHCQGFLLDYLSSGFLLLTQTFPWHNQIWTPVNTKLLSYAMNIDKTHSVGGFHWMIKSTGIAKTRKFILDLSFSGIVPWLELETSDKFLTFPIPNPDICGKCKCSRADQIQTEFFSAALKANVCPCFLLRHSHPETDVISRKQRHLSHFQRCF